jgi:hypothetical protein
MTPPPAAAAAPAVAPRRPLSPRGPRRVSGPARRGRAAQPARTRRAPSGTGIATGLVAGLEALAQHRLLDRLIRGRTWIGIVAFALIGIVTLQLGLLKLNGGIGRALEHEATLQRQNASLSIENSELAAAGRIEARAAHLGMAFAPAGALRFLPASSHGDIAKAATALSAPARASTAESAESTAPSNESGESGEAQGGEPASVGTGEQVAADETESSSHSSSAGDEAGAAAVAEPSATADSTGSARIESKSSSTEAAGAAAESGSGGGTQASATGE